MLGSSCLWLVVLIAVGVGIREATASTYDGEASVGASGQRKTVQEDDDHALFEEHRRQARHFRENYTKHEYRIAMRDGIHLFTTVFAPKDTSKTYPILMRRTPYSVAPYGEDDYPRYPWYLGPPRCFAEAGYIFVYQDVRGRFMSEGDYVNMRPHLDKKAGRDDIDESTDTYDTIEWLLVNVAGHNGRVGMWGISYPGFYAAAGMIDAHPAIQAVSPQAPIADWFFDDFHHHGTFVLPPAFNFFTVFDPPRSGPTTEWGEPFDLGTPDGYQFFMDLGSLKNANERCFKGRVAFWNKIVEHPNYDEFWQSRNILPHLTNVAPAVMTVGGWFDSEDLYGPLKIYRAIEDRNPGVFNVLVMGPWFHGGWDRCDGSMMGNIHFGSATSHFYRENMELPFFNYYLKQQGDLELPEAYMFDTGAKQWRKFDHWPPGDVTSRSFFFRGGGRLLGEPPPPGREACDEYVSDPAKPVPFTEEITTLVPRAFMTDDQRFAARRPDVLVYQTPPLEEDLTLAGPITADLWVSTTESAADWVVKVIDVFPNDTPDRHTAPDVRMGGYQMMVRSEAIRGRFRNSYEHPEPFVPHKPARVTLELLDVLHTFKRGHRIMVQVQSTWFPLIDRNPQRYVDNIYLADEDDFIRATHRLHRSAERPTHIEVGVLNSGTRSGQGDAPGSEPRP